MLKAKLGKYKHFKGGIYEVIANAEDTETGEARVIYRGEDGRIWDRAAANFLDNVDREEIGVVPRFSYVQEEDSPPESGPSFHRDVLKNRN